MFFIRATGRNGSVSLFFESGKWDEPHEEEITPALAQGIGQMFLMAANAAQQDEEGE